MDTIEKMKVQIDTLQVGDINRVGNWIVEKVVHEPNQVTVTWKFVGPSTGMNVKKIGDLSVSHYDPTHHMQIQRHVSYVTEEDLHEMRNGLESWLHG